MDSPPWDHTVIKQHGIVIFSGPEVQAEIYHSMLAEYGSEISIAQQEVYEQVEKFTVGGASVTTKTGPDQPSTSCTQAHIDQGTSFDQRRLTVYVVDSCCTFAAVGPCMHQFSGSPVLIRLRKQCRHGQKAPPPKE